MDIEPITVYSINFIQGIDVFGVKQVIFSVLLFLLGAVCLRMLNKFGISKIKLKRLGVFAFVSFLIVTEVPYLRALFVTAQKGNEVSALYSEQHAEYASRFGDMFAELTDRLFENVPRGEKVYFCRSFLPGYVLESNQVEFLFLTEYRAVSLSDANFVFCHAPVRDELDIIKGRLTDRENQISRTVEPIAVGRAGVILKTKG